MKKTNTETKRNHNFAQGSKEKNSEFKPDLPDSSLLSYLLGSLTSHRTATCPNWALAVPEGHICPYDFFNGGYSFCTGPGDREYSPHPQWPLLLCGDIHSFYKCLLSQVLYQEFSLQQWTKKVQFLISCSLVKPLIKFPFCANTVIGDEDIKITTQSLPSKHSDQLEY